MDLVSEPSVLVAKGSTLSPLADATGGTNPPGKRFDGLDGVRATAMLLGVFYHLPISMYQGGGFGFGASAGPKQSIDDWLHSFRMPLFFLISGFFANMMLRKYGVKQFLFRRWWRIGAPFLVSLFALAGFRMAVGYPQPVNVPPFGIPMFGPPPDTGASFGSPAGINRGLNTPVPFGPYGGTGSPFAGAGVTAGTPLAGPFGGLPDAKELTTPLGPRPGIGPSGFAPPGFGPPSNTTAGLPVTRPPVFQMPTFPSRVWSELLFGQRSRHFGLEHLWFLWYLLVFVTIGPLVVLLLSRLFSLLGTERLDWLGGMLIRFNAFGFVFGLASLPFLLQARNVMGWSLANPHGFMGGFPDFFVQYYPDQPFYFYYFLVGWWLFRLSSSLTSLSKNWLWNLTLGVTAFSASRYLANWYSFRPDTVGIEWIRLGAFSLYAIGSACSTCGFIGFFIRFLNRPTRIGRYFADTALWIYLIHLPLIPYLIWWVQPANGPWWTGSIAGMVVVTGVSLVLFELFIRPTPLNYLYGPPSPKKVALTSLH